MTTHLLKFLIGVFKIAILGFAFIGIGSLLQDPPPEPQVTEIPVPKAMPLTLQQEHSPRIVERFARLAPVKDWPLALEVSGRVAERPVSNGMRLEAGELLIGLDPEPFEAELRRAQAVVKELQAQVQLTQANLERTKRLIQRKAASVEELEQEQAARDRAAAALEAAKSSEAIAEYKLEHSRLVAPTPGIVSNLQAEVGEYITAGQSLGQFSRVDTLLVRVLIPWDVRRGIQTGSEAVIIDGSEDRYAGVLARAAAVESGETGQFELEIEIPNEQNKLQAGEPVRCRFSSGQNRGWIRVPRQTVFEQYGQWRALVPGVAVGRNDAEVVVRSVAVVTGETDPRQGWVEIVSGLKEGDVVLIPQRVASLRDGQEVDYADAVDVWLPPYAQTRLTTLE